MRKANLKLEEIVFLVVAGFSALVSILDFSGILGSIPWLSERVPTLTLLLLTTLSVYQVVEKRNRLDKLEALSLSGTESVLNSIESTKDAITTRINGVNVHEFKDPDELYKYLIARYRKVSRSIEITYFGSHRPPDKTDNSIHGKFYEVFREIINAGKIRVRRIVLARDKIMLEWLEQTISEFSGQSNFYLSCFAVPSLTTCLVSIMIIDSEEVLLTYSEKNFGFAQKTLSIKSPVLTDFFQNYFDLLWRESLVVKGKNVEPVVFDEFKKKMMSNLLF